MRRIPASATPVFAVLLAAACSSGVPAPIAIATAPADVSSGSFVQLDGKQSTDPQGREITYSWTIVTRPLGSNATLIDANTATPSFQADVPGTYVLELKVSTSVSSSTARVTINVSTCKATAPVIASIGATKTAPNLGEAVLLSAAVSDADNVAPCSANQTLTYAWELVRQPQGSAAGLNNARSETPSLTADKPGDYQVRLTVTDSTGLSSQPKVFTLTARNCGASAPVVTASATPQTTHPNADVQLGATVTDADTDAACGLTQTFTYQWSLTSKPNGAAALFSNSRAANPRFTADTAGSYEVQVVATDNTGLSSQPSVATVTVDRCGEAGPAADGIAFSAGTSGTPAAGTVGTAIIAQAVNARSLNCLATGAPTQRWSLTVPPGSHAALDNAGATAPSFLPDVPGAYDLQLTLLDSAGRTSVPVFAHVSVANCVAVPPAFGATPIAVSVTDPGAPVITDASGATMPHVGASVQLTANASVTSYCGAIATGPLHFAWTLAQRPAGSKAQLDLSTPSPSFVPDVNGQYRVAVVATDARGVSSAAQSVLIKTTACGTNPLTASLFTDSAGGLVPLSTSAAAPQAVQSFAPFAVVATVSTDDNDAALCPARFHLTPDVSYSLAIQPSVNAGSLSSVFGDSTLFEARAPGAYAVEVDAAATNLSGRVHATPVFAYFSAAACSAPSVAASFFSPTGGAVFRGDQVTVSADAQPGSCGTAAPIITYAWSLAPSAPSSASLASPGSSLTSFIADVAGGSFVATVVVTDLQGNHSQPASLVIPVSTCGNNPVQATALEVPFGVRPFDARSLAVIASSQDNSGSCPGRFAQTFTYAWSVVSPVGTGASFDAPSSAQTTFTPGGGFAYTLQVVVSGSNGQSATRTLIVDAQCTGLPVTTSPVQVSVQGEGLAQFPRVPVAGSYRVFRDDVVTLSTATAAQCTSAALTYSWTLTAPNGSTSQLSSATAAAPSFVIDQPNGVYVATVVARDKFGNASVPQSASFTATSCGANPISVAISDTPGAKAFDDHVLQVTGPAGGFISNDDNPALCPAHFASPYSYQWSMSSSASNGGFLFDNTSGPTVHFSPGGSGTYSVKVSVARGAVQAETLRQVSVSCFDPVPQTGQLRILSSTPGYAPGMFFRDDTAALIAQPTSQCFSNAASAGFAYQWSLQSLSGSTSTLSSATAAVPTFAVDVAGAKWTATLVVMDKLGNKSPLTSQDFTAQTCGINSVSASISVTRPAGSLAFDPYLLTTSAVSNDDDVALCPARFAQTYSVVWSSNSTPAYTDTRFTGPSVPALAPGAPATATLNPGGNGTYTISAQFTGSKSGRTANPSQDITVDCADPVPTKVTAPAISLVTPPPADTFARSPGQFFRDDTLTLTATASSACFSPGNTSFSYGWTLSPVNPPALSGATTQTPSFVVDTPGGSYTASVVATDSIHNASGAAQSTFTADTCGANPVAARIMDVSAGLPFDPHTLTALPLSGPFFSGDDNPAQCPARFAQTYMFAWSVVAPTGAQFDLSQAMANATFAAGTNGGYDISVLVTGLKQGSSTPHDIFTVNCIETAPAVSMPDTTTITDPDAYATNGRVFAGDTVAVTGSATHACYTGNNFHPTYNWSFASDDPGNAHFTAIASPPSASFTSTTPSRSYEVTLFVRDQWLHEGNRSTTFTSEACGANAVNVSVDVSRLTGTLPFDPYTVNAVASSTDDNGAVCPPRFGQTYSTTWTVTATGGATHFTSGPASGPTTVLNAGENDTYRITATTSGDKSHVTGTAFADVTVSCSDPLPHFLTPAIDIVQVTPATPDAYYAAHPSDFFKNDNVKLQAPVDFACYTGTNAGLNYSWALAVVPDTRPGSPTLNNANQAMPDFNADQANRTFLASVTAADRWAHQATQTLPFSSGICGEAPIHVAALAAPNGLPMDPWTLTATPSSGTFFSDDSDPSKCPSRFAPTYNFAWSSTPDAPFSSTTTNPTTFSPAAPTSYLVHVDVSGNGQSSGANAPVDATCAAPTISGPAITSVNGGPPATIYVNDLVQVGTAASSNCFTTPTLAYTYGLSVNGGTAFETLSPSSGPDRVFSPTVFGGAYVVSVIVADGSGLSTSGTLPISVSACGAAAPTVSLVQATQHFDGIERPLAVFAPLDLTLTPPATEPVTTDSGVDYPVPFYLATPVSGRVKVDSTTAAACGSFNVVSARLVDPDGNDVTGGDFTAPASGSVADSGSLDFAFTPRIGDHGSSPVVPGNYTLRLTVAFGGPHSTMQTEVAAPAVHVGGRCGLNQPSPSVDFTPASSTTVPVDVSATAAGSSDADNAPLELIAVDPVTSTGCGLNQGLTYSWVLVSVPTASATSASPDTGLTTGFTADEFGTYELQLSVSDGTGSGTGVSTFLFTAAP